MTLNGETKIESSTIDWQNPYPALSSFREEDKEYFFGRDKEIRELVDRIEKNVLTVLLGKSGVGKTSLLQAGLMPELKKKYYLPIYLRINYDNKKTSPIAQVKEAIESKIKKVDKTIDSIGDLSLWEYFYKVRILGGVVTPLLFFDQFEELFEAGKEDPEKVDLLVTELGDLAQNWLPLTVQERYKNQRIPYAEKEPNYRVLLSLREDYFLQLKNLRRFMPSVVKDRYHYRVHQLKGRGALGAVLKPGKEIIKDETVAVEIIQKIPGSEDTDYSPYEEQNGSWEGKKIEPFLLSLFCYKINAIRVGQEKEVITRELLKVVKAKTIMEDFYEKNIEKFRPDVKIALEELLLTPEGRRIFVPVKGGRLESEYDVSDDEIKTLENKRIIRKVERGEVKYIELIHDVLAPILKESRDERKLEEKQRDDLKKEEEKRKKQLAAKQKKFLIIIAVIFIVATIVSTKFGLDANIQKDKAEKKSRNNKAYALAARSANLLSKDAGVSFRLAEEAYNTEKNNPVAYNALLDAYFKRDVTPREFHPQSQTAQFFAVFCPPKEKLRFVTVSSEKLILWELSGGNEYRTEQENNLGLGEKAAVSPDGNYFAFLTKDDNIIGLWNLAEKTIKPKGLDVLGGVNSVAFSPDGEKILTGNRDNTARLWDLNALIEGRKDKPLVVFKGHGNEVNSAVFSPDGKYVVTGGWDGTARLWSSGGNEIEKFNCSTDSSVDSAVFSPDGKYIVTSDSHTKVQLWNLKGKELRTFEGHTGGVKSAMFSPNGKYIITAGDDETARLWDSDGNQVFKFEGFKAIIHTASFSPDGKYVLIAPAEGPARLRLVDPETIIRFADKNGVPRLTEEKKKEYNIIE